MAVYEFAPQLQARGQQYYRWLRMRSQTTGEYVAFDPEITYTYTLRSSAGVEILTETALIDSSDATVLAIKVREPPDALVAPGAYRETWEQTDHTDDPPPPAVADVYLSTSTIQPPYAIAEVVAARPDLLTRVPRGQTSWMPQRLAAREAVAARLISRAEASAHDVWSMYRLRQHWYHTELATYLRAVSGGSPAIEAIANDEDARAEAAWPWRLDVDTDGDGAVDETMTSTAPDEASPPVVR